MPQRYEHLSIEQELSRAQQELLPEFQSLTHIPFENITSSDSAQYIISMINKLTSPILGLQVIRKNLIESEYPFINQYHMIMQKAEMFYMQSLSLDLNRIRNNQIIMQISKEQIAQCIDQINWKIDVERTSKLNESQEVQQNIDLMKFFEGVRSYQNTQQSIKKQCLQKLKERAHQIQKQVTFKKGYFLSRIDQIVNSNQQKNKKHFFYVEKKNQSKFKTINILSKCFARKKREVFQAIQNIGANSFKQAQIAKFFNRYLLKSSILELKRFTSIFKYRLNNIEMLQNRINQIKRKIQSKAMLDFLKKINLKPMIKASNLAQSIFKINETCKKVIVRQIVKNFNLPVKSIITILQINYFQRVQTFFRQIKQHYITSKIDRPQISDRIKGKVLASLQKFQSEPTNSKKLFYKWYINTHQQKVSKKVYNIWLHGPTSKFTVFMRLKNMCHLISKQKISKELRNFLKVLGQKYGKYETYNKHKRFTQWISNTRIIRKIQKMIKTISSVQNETEQVYKKEANQKIKDYCRKNLIVKIYCTKYLLNYTQNVKSSLLKWTNINNIKKQWGRKKLRSILLNLCDEIQQQKLEILSVLKQNRIQGRQKKISLCRKVINKDSIFLQRFIQTWKYNIRTDKFEKKVINQKITNNNQNSLIMIQNCFKKILKRKLQQTLLNLKNNKVDSVNKQKAISNSFYPLIKRGQSVVKNQILQIFKQNYFNGKQKKNKLVIDLFNSNVTKQKISFLIMNSKALQMAKYDKIKRTQVFFQKTTQVSKQNFLIFNKNLFVAKYLSRYLKNYTQNIKLSLGMWKMMPERMRWKLRDKVINFHEKISKLMLLKLSHTNQQFKMSVATGKAKQRKGIYIMACKFQQFIGRYFKRYHENSVNMKKQKQIEYVSKLFQFSQVTVNNQLSTVFRAVPQWPKKMQQIQKLNEKAKKRLMDYFNYWYKAAKQKSFHINVLLQKKKRCLEIFNKVIFSTEQRGIIKIIDLFNKNKRVQSLQLNFLKKLCESQAGKVVKGFLTWKGMPEPKNKQKIKKASKFQSNMHRYFVKNLKLTLNVFKDNCYFGNQSKKVCIRKLVATSCSGISQYFDKWRGNTKLWNLFNKNRKTEGLFETLTKINQTQFRQLIKGDEIKLKTQGLKIIEQYWKKRQANYIKRWQKNTQNLRLKDVYKKYLLIGVDDIMKRYQKAKLQEKVLSQFIINRHAKLKQLKQIQINKTLKLVQNCQEIKRRHLNQTCDRLKLNRHEGNFKKSRFFFKFVDEKIKTVHEMLSIWNNLAQKVKQDERKLVLTSNFDQFFERTKKNFNFIFARSREVIKKKECIDRIFASTETKFRGYLQLWKNKARQIKMASEFDNQKKKVILSKINSIISSTSTQQVIETIRKFHLNSKATRVQKKFMERLMQTKGGKVVQALNNWKGIPINTRSGKYKDFQKSYFKLEEFFKSRLKLVHSIFTETSEDGNLMKKQSILKLFEMTSLGIRRFYNRWTRMTKQKLILTQVQKTFKVLELGEELIKNQLMIMFEDDRSYKLKISSIEKLIQATKNNTQTCFDKWRQNTKLLKIQSSMDDQKKKMALKMFSKVIDNSTTGSVINIIRQFNKNSKVVKISKSFFNRLMNTKTGKVLGFFTKLKTIPDAKLNKMKKKGIIFQSRLNLFVLKRFRQLLVPFKTNIYEADNKKKFCLDKLARACMGQNQKKFIIWRNVVRQSKILSHTFLFDKIFIDMEKTVKENFKIINNNTSGEISKKKNLCRKLINNSLFVQHHAFMIWRQAYHIDDINITKRQNFTQNHLNNFIQIFKENQSKKTIQLISAFKRLLQIKNYQQFNMFKDYKSQRLLHLYHCLQGMNRVSKSVFINSLRNNQTECITRQKSKKSLSVFQLILQKTKQTTNYMFKVTQETEILNKLFNRLKANVNSNLMKGFQLWRQNRIALLLKKDINNQRKRQMLLQLNGLINANKEHKSKDIIEKFKLNVKVQLIKKALCLKMITAKSTRFYNSFNIWKGIPYQQARKLKSKATKFERGIFNVLFNHLKFAHSQFKRNQAESISKRQQSARNIVKSKLAQINNLFSKWKKVNHVEKVKQKFLSLGKVFQLTEEIYKNNLNIFSETGSNVKSNKSDVATRLFKNNVNKLSSYFHKWLNNTKVNKLHTLQKHLQLFNPDLYNKNLVRIGFLMIMKKNEIQALKGYINSLWKWKMSNIQASYYSKFIKVFKEGEQLINFSKLLTKKSYQNIHHAFRNILAAGHERTNRKKEIVGKYLLRKAKNYFAQFKNKTSVNQINVWRSKYTVGIKAKIWIDVLSGVFLKQKFSSFNKIKNFMTYTHNINELSTKLDNIQTNQLADAFNKIKYCPYKQIFHISALLNQKLKQDHLKEVFAFLKNNYRCRKFTEILEKLFNKKRLGHSLSRINRRGEKAIKSKISISLLQTLLQNKNYLNIKTVIKQFKNNRSMKIGSQKIFKLLLNKYLYYQRSLFDGGNMIMNFGRMIQQFKRAQILKKILEKQDEQLKRTYFNRMKKKENVWKSLAIKKFATRVMLRSSPIVSLWRLKTYAQNA